MIYEIKDVVERLLSFRPEYGWPEETSTIVEPMLNEVAADEITRLRAEVARLRAALRKADEGCSFMHLDEPR